MTVSFSTYQNEGTFAEAIMPRVRWLQSMKTETYRQWMVRTQTPTISYSAYQLGYTSSHAGTFAEAMPRVRLGCDRLSRQTVAVRAEMLTSVDYYFSS